MRLGLLQQPTHSVDQRPDLFVERALDIEGRLVAFVSPPPDSRRDNSTRVGGDNRLVVAAVPPVTNAGGDHSATIRIESITRLPELNWRGQKAGYGRSARIGRSLS